MDRGREQISKAGSHGWQTNKQREKTSKQRRWGTMQSEAGQESGIRTYTGCEQDLQCKAVRQAEARGEPGRKQTGVNTNEGETLNIVRLTGWA